MPSSRRSSSCWTKFNHMGQAFWHFLPRFLPSHKLRSRKTVSRSVFSATPATLSRRNFDSFFHCRTTFEKPMSNLGSILPWLMATGLGNCPFPRRMSSDKTESLRRCTPMGTMSREWNRRTFSPHWASILVGRYCRIFSSLMVAALMVTPFSAIASFLFSAHKFGRLDFSTFGRFRQPRYHPDS